MTSSGPGTGSATSTTWRTSVSPWSASTMARISAPRGVGVGEDLAAGPAVVGLAGRGALDVGGELPRPGHLDPGQVLAGVGLELVGRRGGGARPHADHGADPLAEAFVGHADDE